MGCAAVFVPLTGALLKMMPCCGIRIASTDAQIWVDPLHARRAILPTTSWEEQRIVQEGCKFSVRR